MEYTVQKLGKLAGISTRTLRYYHQIGLLVPSRINSSGYRIYSQAEVDQLQQILFYKQLGVSLDAIKRIITDPSFNSTHALYDHREKLLTKREELDKMISTVNKTLDNREGRTTMTDKEKFEGLKQKMIDENEKEFGKEIRKTYGDAQVDKSNQKMKGMTQEQFERAEKLGEEVLVTLSEAFETKDPSSDLARKTADLHRQWISLYWNSYTKEAHAGVAQLYVDDERFTAFYDKDQPGKAAFLRDAIHIYTDMVDN
ncbi:MerR family transcriptional regulator [Aquibacillus saliphilus]|uniref:MerR family transcriptional regulator n=1 Tax=Aquibacillus saliphilus TaxID=1909422 RepID=UPI001CF022B3|nr:MerR family transcriptional regulator [Aquibacillus saliphilus]